MQLNAFHEVRFPTDISLGATGGPARRTEIVTMGSGQEQRNTRWANSRRKYNAGYGIKTIDDLNMLIEFFEERRGRLFGFRFRDPLDWKSCKPSQTISALDQTLGEGNAQQREFKITKYYGAQDTGYLRTISKPVSQTVLVAVDGVSIPDDRYSVEHANGTISFSQEAIPSQGASITCGYEFDVPVRFDLDEISINLRNFQAGDIPSIPLVELLT